jgi:hypothetical protein
MTLYLSLYVLCLVGRGGPKRVRQTIAYLVSLRNIVFLIRGVLMKETTAFVSCLLEGAYASPPEMAVA